MCMLFGPFRMEVRINDYSNEFNSFILISISNYANAIYETQESSEALADTPKQHKLTQKVQLIRL